MNIKKRLKQNKGSVITAICIYAISLVLLLKFDNYLQLSCVAYAEENTFETTCANIDDIPVYEGSPSKTINQNVPFFSKNEKEKTSSFESYSKLDSKKRCGVAYANLCKELMPTEDRGEIGSVKPSGWHTVKYNGVIDGNYLYNRCHLIGFQLAGENANKKNLITGTRYLNVEGMLPYENMVADYIRSTNNHVLYRVTPVFVNDELVCRGILMEAYSVEDQGKGISFCVYCFNVQPGISIDYKTGESTLLDGYTVKEGTITEVKGSSKEPKVTTTGSEAYYVLNTNTKKFHKPSCSSVKQMSQKNYAEATNRDQIVADGYVPCKKCNP